jgi:hypothetical protein
MGDNGCTVESEGGSDARIAAIVDDAVLPSNARLPVTISYSTAPSAKMSQRASASLPSSCSGAMYWKVPTTMPAMVSGCWGVATVCVSPELAEPAGVTGFARPKSISLAPLFVSMMLPGFRSRWMTSLRCAFSSPSQISIPHFKT